MKIGIIGAMGCEVSSIQESLINSQTETIAKMEFIFGEYSNISVVSVICGIGKVNAAIGTSILINHFNVDCVINMGIAGATDEKLDIEDIVISYEVTYHDYDSRQLVHSYPKMEDKVFRSDNELAGLFIKALGDEFGNNKVNLGKVVSGDRFIADHSERNQIRHLFDATCLDMEGAAIAHVSYVYSTPCVLIKVISDKADEKASISFREFLQHVPQINKEIFINIIEAIKGR